MRGRFFLKLFVLLLLTACSGHNLPSGVLPSKKMVSILVDIHLSEAINNHKYNISMIRDSLPEDLYLSICKKHQVDRADIEKSLLYYGKHTKEFVPVYNEVLNILSEMEIKAKSDSARPIHSGGYDLDTSKIKKTSPTAVKTKTADH